MGDSAPQLYRSAFRAWEKYVSMKCAVPAEGESPSRTEGNTLGKRWSVESVAGEGRGGRRMNGNSSFCSFNFIDLVINNGNEP